MAKSKGIRKVPASAVKVKEKQVKRSIPRGNKATAILYGTRGLKEQAIRAAIAYHKENPEQTLDDVFLYKFGITIGQRKSWVKIIGLTDFYNDHLREMARKTLILPTVRDPHKYDEDNRIKLMRRVLNGLREDPETSFIAQAVERYGEGIDTAHFYSWLKSYDGMTWELRGTQAVLEATTHLGRPLSYFCDGLDCPELEQITALMGMIHLYSTPQSISRNKALVGPVKGQAIEFGFMDRDACLQMVGLSHRAWWMMTNRDGMLHDAWMVAVGKRDRAMTEARQDVRAKLKLLVDDAMVLAMTPNVVTHSEKVVQTQFDKFGNEIGMVETVRHKTQEAPDPKFIPYVHKFLGEAPREEAQQSQHYIIYEEAANETRLEVIGTEQEQTVEELEARRLERKSEVLGSTVAIERVFNPDAPREREAAEDV